MKKPSDGFTLLELVMVMVITGIALPAVLLPFISTAKGTGMAGDTATLTYLARGNMENELASVDREWPLVGGTDFSLETFPQTINGRRYGVTIKRIFLDHEFAATNGNPSQNNNRYLAVEVTTSDERGNVITLETLKTRDYP